MKSRFRLGHVWILCFLLGFLSACKKSEPAQKPAAQADHNASEHAVQAPHATNCANLTWPTTIAAKYPPNANPGFNSPEEVTALLEERWSLANIRKFAIPERRFSPHWQNLVLSTPEVWGGRLYCDQATGFDSIEWYANVENGRATEYSLGAMRGTDFWVLEIGDPVSVRKPPQVEPDFRARHFVGHK